MSLNQPYSGMGMGMGTHGSMYPGTHGGMHGSMMPSSLGMSGLDPYSSLGLGGMSCLDAAESMSSPLEKPEEGLEPLELSEDSPSSSE